MKDIYDLIKKSKSGDKNAFSEIYRQTCKELHKYCRNLCGNNFDADDLMQQVYLTAWTKINQFCGDNISSWLRSIAHNTFLDNLKKKRPEYLSDEEFYEIPEDRKLIPENIADRKELCEIILKVLNDCLSPMQKATVLLYYYDEKSVSEISKIMQCSEGTVESRLYYSRKKLRERLSKIRNIFLYGVPLIVIKHKLKNIKIPVNARITASVVLTAAAMTAVSVNNIEIMESRTPNEIIKIESMTDMTNITTVPEKQPTTANISRVSYTMPTNKPNETSPENRYITDTTVEQTEIREETTAQEKGDTEEITAAESLTEIIEEDTTMKKELITIATAATMAVSGMTVTTANADDIFDGYNYKKYTFSELIEMSDKDFIELDSYKGDISREYWTSSDMYRCIYKILNGSGGVRINLDDNFSRFDEYAESWDIGTEKTLFEIPIDTEIQEEIRQEISEITGKVYADEICSIVKLDNFEGIDTGISEYLITSYLSPVFNLNVDETSFDENKFADEMEKLFSQNLRYTVSKENSHVFVNFEIPECYEVNQKNVLYFAKLYYALTSIDKNFDYSNFYTMSGEEKNLFSNYAIVSGDSNNDGRMSISDSVAILQNLANAEKYPLSVQGKYNADCDGNDGITGLDAAYIQHIEASES